LSLQVGVSRTDSGYAYIDLVGDTTYSDYGLRLIRNNSGANTSSELLHRGTGVLSINAVEAAPLQLATSNTARLYINSSGNVGIGTTSPTAKLQVDGATIVNGANLRIYLNGAESVSPHLYIANSANSEAYNWQPSATGNKLYLWTYSTTDRASWANMFTFTALGNFGINTTSPQTKLHVWTGTTGPSVEALRLTGAYGASGDGPLLRFTNYLSYATNPNSGEYNLAAIRALDFASAWGGALQFQTATNVSGGGTLTTAMTIDPSQNVGIGTTSPANKLHLNGGKFIFTSDDGSYGQLQVNAPSGGEATIVFGSTGSGQNSGGYTNAGVIGIGAYGNSRDILVLGTGYSGGTMFLKNGNVGINTTSPGEKLAVSGNITVTGNLAVSTGNTTGGGIILADDGDIVDLNDGYCSMRFSLGVRVFSANRGGSAVIKLDNGGNIVSSANITAYGSPSDARKKNNIEPLQGALNIVKQLRGVTFNWNDNTDEAQYTKLKEDIGFIAQEVREIVPTIVREDTEGYLSIRDRALIPILVEAIKELNAKIDKLEGKY
jgi:hypothetical protein